MLQKHFFLGFLLLPILLQVVTSQTIAKQGQPSQPPKDPLTPLQHAPLTIPLQSAPAPAPALPPKPQTINKTPTSSTNEQRTVPQRTSVPAAHHPQTPAAAASSSGHTSPSGQPQPPPKQLTKPVPVKRTMNSFNGPLSYGNNNKLIQSLINQYNGQYVQKPSTVYRSPLPSSSLQSLMNSITSGFNLRPIGRRSGKGSPLDNALYSLNAIPDSTGGNVGAPGEFNINNINAINEMISTALNTMNSAGGGNPMNPAGNAGVNSGLMSTVGSFLSSNIGKPSKKLLFEFPKAIYKSIGEKISGAGEAAVSATVPLKDSFFSTIKSFYSYLKPNRAGGGAQLTESNLAAAAAAAAAGFTVEQYNRQPVQFNSQQFDPTTSAQFNQALQQALFGMSSAESQQQQQPSSKVIPYGTRMQPLESQQIPVLHHHHQQQPHHSSGLYARSKELFNKIARKAAPRHPQPAQPAQPQIAQFPGQFLGSPAAPNQQLSSQILTKVQSKLGTLPTAYNQQQQLDQSMMVEGHDQGMMSDQAADGPLYYFESGPGASGAGHQEGHSSEDQAAAAQHQPTDSN
ncbi:hypothetical protein TYRP_016177 [Tyrophagus putrescentiae]|nr:hypothetical protein TYRP_016177 [Tyrophagus putrescentiae]